MLLPFGLIGMQDSPGVVHSLSLEQIWKPLPPSPKWAHEAWQADP